MTRRDQVPSNAYEQVLRGMVATPEAKISEIQLLDEDQQKKVLTQWNDTSEGANVQEAVSPYTRFVRSRRGELTGLHDELAGSADALARLRSQIEAL